MFYLTTHSTHFLIYGYMVEHMVKDPSDSKRGNPLLPELLFPISSKGSFICTFTQIMIAHVTAFVMPVVEHWRHNVKNISLCI